MPQPVGIFLVLLVLAMYLPTASAATNQFQNWYQEFAFIFETILHQNCTKEYDMYLTGKKHINGFDRLTGGDPTNQLAQPVVNCILSSTSEFIKSAMASAQVLLGLTPTMLAVLGPSTEETSVLFVVGRRPFLALCLAAGSPAVFPMRSFDGQDPLNILKERQGRLRPPQIQGIHENVIMIVQYAVTIGAITNIAMVSKQLGVSVISNFAPHSTYLVLLWAFLILLLHCSGSFALMCRVRVISEGDDTGLSWLRRQFVPVNDRYRVRVQLIPENYWFVFFSWFTTILTICHVIYGTLVFSSLLFISVRDSLPVIARYMVSVICCRVVLMYELASLRNSFNVATIDESGVELHTDFQTKSGASDTVTHTVIGTSGDQPRSW